MLSATALKFQIGQLVKISYNFDRRLLRKCDDGSVDTVFVPHNDLMTIIDVKERITKDFDVIVTFVVQHPTKGRLCGNVNDFIAAEVQTYW